MALDGVERESYPGPAGFPRPPASLLHGHGPVLLGPLEQVLHHLIGALLLGGPHDLLAAALRTPSKEPGPGGRRDERERGRKKWEWEEREGDERKRVEREIACFRVWVIDAQYRRIKTCPYKRREKVFVCSCERLCVCVIRVCVCVCDQHWFFESFEYI